MPCRHSWCAKGSLAVTAIVALGWLWIMQAAAADDNASLRALADAARTTLAQRIEPPVSLLPFVCTLRRTETAPMREYILEQQSAAIEALINSATTPAATKRVRRLLEELQRDGYAREADARLADTAPGGAAGLRLAASLGELPAALTSRLSPGNCGNSYLGLLGRTFVPIGTLARADYQRLVELEPENSWHALVLAWLAGTEGEMPLQRILATRAPPDSKVARVQMLAWQQLAWLHSQQGRADAATQAANQALRAAQDIMRNSRADAQPRIMQATRDVSQATSTLALVLEDTGQSDVALQTLLDLAAQQQQLLAMQPEDTRLELALIDTLCRLGLLQAKAGPSAAASSKANLEQALAMYRRLEQRTPYAPMLTAWSGMFIMACAMSGALTLLGGWALLWRYRRRIAQLMSAAAHGAVTSAPADSTLALTAAIPLPQPTNIDAIDTRAANTLRHATLVQIAAGVSFGVAAAWLLLAYDLEPSVLKVALLSWTWGWPSVVATSLIRDGDRRHQRVAWAVYFMGLLLLCVLIGLGDTPPLTMFGIALPAFLQPLLFWLLNLSFSPFLLLFLNRSVRSIGPSLLAMMLVAMLGGTLAMVAGSTPAGMRVLASIAAASSLPAGAMPALAAFAGILAAAPLGGWLGRRLRAAYVAKWVSDQNLMIDTLWGFQSVLLGFELSRSVGPVGWLGMGVFALHKAITLAGMVPAARAARRHSPARLLLLRVFMRRGQPGRAQSRRSDAERWFDLLGSRWRYIGPITMIGAPDLASSNIDPQKFLDFLGGTLHERFIVDPSEVPRHLAALSDICDLDARWRVSELFCGNDAWRPAVQGLMARTHLVAMDLRDFGPNNSGCIFELQALIDLVPARRVALLIDASTHRDFLQTTIAGCLERASITSPNASTGFRPALLDVARGERHAVDELLKMTTGLG